MLNDAVYDTPDFTVIPETPAVDADGVHVPTGAAAIKTFDIEFPDRAGQRLRSAAINWGFDEILQSGADGTSNLETYDETLLNRMLYLAYGILLRLNWLATDPDGGSYIDGYLVQSDAGINHVSRFAFTSSQGWTTALSFNHGSDDPRSLGVLGRFHPYDPNGVYGEVNEEAFIEVFGRAVTPYLDYVYCNGEVSLITDCSLGSSASSLTLDRAVNPAFAGNLFYIVKRLAPPTSLPYIQPHRNLFTTQMETAWLPLASLETDYTLFAGRISYPVKWHYNELGLLNLRGTFRVLAATDSSGAGETDITDAVLGATPASGYVYPNFPGANAALKFKNDGGGYVTILNLSAVAVPEGTTHIKVHYRGECADQDNPDTGAGCPTTTGCRHCIHTPNPALAGSKSSWMSKVIDGQYYCSKYDLLTTAEADEFQAMCNNSTCSQYAVSTPYYAQPSDINNYLLNRGTYLRQLTPGLSSIQNWRIGRETYDGLLHLIGFPAYNWGGLYLAAKSFFGNGVMQWDSTLTDATTGYRRFMNWSSAMAYKRDEVGGDATDTYGPLSVFSPSVAKQDSAGGVESDHDLKTYGGSRPGFSFESTIGHRRTGERGAWDYATVDGPGNAEVQRVQPFRFTSLTFVKGQSQTVADFFTKTTVFSSPLVTAGDFNYDISFKVARYGRSVDDEDFTEKSVFGTIYDSSISGDVLTIEFMPMFDFTIHNVGALNALNFFTRGGNIVASDNAWRNANPAALEPFGTYENKVCPGDVMTIEGIHLPVISAQAMAGSTINSGTVTNASTIRVDQSVGGAFNPPFDYTDFESSAPDGYSWNEAAEQFRNAGGDVWIPDVDYYTRQISILGTDYPDPIDENEESSDGDTAVKVVPHYETDYADYGSGTGNPIAYKPYTPFSPDADRVEDIFLDETLNPDAFTGFSHGTQGLVLRRKYVSDLVAAFISSGDPADAEYSVAWHYTANGQGWNSAAGTHNAAKLTENIEFLVQNSEFNDAETGTSKRALPCLELILTPDFTKTFSFEVLDDYLNEYVEVALTNGGEKTGTNKHLQIPTATETFYWYTENSKTFIILPLELWGRQVRFTYIVHSSVTVEIADPNASAPYIPDELRAYNRKADVVKLSLADAENGEAMKTLHASLGSLASYENTAVSFRAVAPPRNLYNDASTGFDPVLKRVNMDTEAVTTLSEGADYVFDSVEGKFYVDSSGWAAGQYRLHAEMHVYDTRQTLNPEDVMQMFANLESACNLFIPFAVRPGPSITVALVSSIDDWETWLPSVPLIPAFSWAEPGGRIGDTNHGDALEYFWDAIFESVVTEEDYRTDVGLSSPKWIGAAWFPNWFVYSPANEAYPHFQVYNELAFTGYNAPQRITADEVERAYLDVGINGATLTRYRDSWGGLYDEEDTTPPFPEPIVDSTVEVTPLESGAYLTLALCLVTIDGTSATFTVVGQVAPSWVNVGSDNYRATVDVTNIVKYTITNRPGANQFYAWTLAGPLELTGISAHDLLWSFCTVCDINAGVDDLMSSFDVETYIIRYNAMTWGRLMIQPNYAAVKSNAHQWHFNHNGGQADDIDLLYAGPD